ncbi:hypothetical protein ACI3KT_11875 [Microbacterium sp. ZW T6_19]|uniref:hypothetical protein n=1 Tax=Microbacterium sp. ZW T6_19 TaxID=3378082 RepID=UPI0038530A9A
MDHRPRMRPVLTPAQERDQVILDAAAARRAAGEKVRALRGAEDGRLRIYTKAEAGPAWSRSSSSRAVFALSGQLVLFAIISAILALMVVMAVRFDGSEQGAIFVGVFVVGAVWVATAVIVIRSIIAARLRRRSGLPAPRPNSDHL